jgi:DeoR family glycerol-3-phosphate regulon repressor
VARAIVEQSSQVWLVADHSKFGRTAMIEMAPLKVVHTLFTDLPPEPGFEQRLREQGVTCVVAQGDKGDNGANGALNPEAV